MLQKCLYASLFSHNVLKLNDTRGRTLMHTYEALQSAVPRSPPACSVSLHKQANVTPAGHVTGTSISAVTTVREEGDERGGRQ